MGVLVTDTDLERRVNHYAPVMTNRRGKYWDSKRKRQTDLRIARLGLKFTLAGMIISWVVLCLYIGGHR